MRIKNMEYYQKCHAKGTLTSFTFGYFLHDDIVETYFVINLMNQSKDFTDTTIP